MQFSKFFVPTIKEVPKECVLKSHIYLLRAGYIHQIGSGIYNFLPLGKIMLDKIKNIIKKRMDEAGANEVAMGFLTPANLWEKTGRYERYSELAIFKDRKNVGFVLGPTHEECVTQLVKSYVKSHKQLPLNLYQIHLKFRDELRPRFGLLRAREFVMKDAYSFHADSESLDKEFENMRETYVKIFSDLGLDFRIVEADSGAIGGSGSREFMVLAECGEDTLVVCENCEYASNIEAAKRANVTTESIAPQVSIPYHKFATPGIKSIEDLSKFFNVDKFYLIKAVVMRVVFSEGCGIEGSAKAYPDSDRVAVFFLRGMDKLETTKALNALCNIDPNVLNVVDAELEFLAEHRLPQGSIGPVHLRSLVDTQFIVFDESLRDGEDLICGANEDGYHYVGVNLGEFKDLVYADLVAVQEGDKCALCGGNLCYKKGIEVGHIFKLGDKYSKPLEAHFLDSNGREKPFIMGCYGIGVTRLLSAILEQKADNKGCIWGDLSPFKIDIIISNVKDSKQFEFAFGLYNALVNSGVSVIIDDRNERFGSKINDFELIGFEYALIIGKGLESGIVELVKRAGLDKREIACDRALDELREIL